MSNVTARYNLLFNHRRVLVHSPLRGSSRVLVVCPKTFAPIAATLSQIVQHHIIGFGGSVRAVHPSTSVLPTVDTIRGLLGEQKFPHLDLVVVFGYKNVQLASDDVTIKLWIDGLAGLVRSHWAAGGRRGGRLQAERTRGELLIEIASKSEEAWEHTAKRYDRLLHDMGVRLDTINSLHRSNTADVKITALRHDTLARNLGRIPGGGYDRFIGYLNSHAKILSKHIPGLKKTAIEKEDALLGLFIPDASTSAESWWEYTDLWVATNKIGGIWRYAGEVGDEIMNEWKAEVPGQDVDVETDTHREMDKEDVDQVMVDSVEEDAVDDVEDDKVDGAEEDGVSEMEQ
jgi:hypothetical protein